MTKKRAVIWVLAAEALIYLFLLVLWPMLAEAVYSAGALPEAKDIVVEIKNGWALKYIPGLFGAGIILLILRQKEAKSE